MTATTCLTRDVLHQLAEAQVVIDLHVAFSRRGVCGLCNQPEPCERRDEAQALFLRYGRLPRRTPMLTFATASRWPAGGWFDEPTARRIADDAEEPADEA